MFGFGKKKQPPSQADILLTMAQHCSRVGLAMANDLSAFYDNKPRKSCMAIDIESFAGLQEKPDIKTPGNPGYLVLGQASDEGDLLFENMTNLWLIQGNVELFKNIFDSDEMCRNYFGKTPIEGMETMLEQAIIRAFVVSGNFLLTSEADRKDYLLKVSYGNISEEEMNDFSEMRKSCLKVSSDIIKKSRSLFSNKARYDKFAHEELGKFFSFPVYLRAKAELCTKSNGVWMENHVLQNFLDNVQKT